MDVSRVHVSDPSLALNTESWQKATVAPEPVLKKNGTCSTTRGVLIVRFKSSKVCIQLLNKEEDKGDPSGRNKFALMAGLGRF